MCDLMLLLPPTIAATESTLFNARWAAGGPWIEG